MYYSDDPVRDFMMHDAKQTQWLEQQPVCSECDEHIQDEYCYEINGELICEDCLNTNHKKRTEDYIE